MTWLPPHRHTLEDCKRNVAEAEAAAPDPVASPAPLDVERLARALHIGGVTTGGASHPESCNSTWHLEQANRVGFLYDNAITTRLEGQPVAEGRE